MSDYENQPTERPPADPKAKKEPPRGGFHYFLMMILFILLGSWLIQSVWTVQSTPVAYSLFWSQLEQGNVREVMVRGLTIEGRWKNVNTAQTELDKLADESKALDKKAEEAKEDAKSEDTKDSEEKSGSDVTLEDYFSTEVPPYEDGTLVRTLQDKGVKIQSETNGFSSLLVQSLVAALPFVLILMFIMFVLRRSSDPMNSGMFGSFVKSPAKRFRPSDHKTTFDDVAGMSHAKRELQEVVEFLKEPAKFQRLGAEIPKGVLLMGPPGTGKTLLARAVAGEAGVPFFSINGSEFIQMFVGVGASRVRDMFKQAKESAPCILFVDEIDAVGRERGAGLGGGHDEREQTLNQILSEMDGFEASEAVIVIAATNRPDVLDPALLRPGRFDRHVTVDKPSREGRLGILKVHARKVPLSKDVDLERMANVTIGFSGADLKNLVNEAALHAAREGHTEVMHDDFESARDKIIMGVPREELMNDKEREMTAYHEAGHALIAWLLPELDPVHKVTIVPRGRALGVTQLLPEEERLHMGENRLRQQLAMALGGRAAEKIVFDEYSAGAESDLKQASQIARRMVSAWGMSDVIGPVAFRDGEEHPFLGKEIHEARKFSDQTAHVIDQEMQKILRGAEKVAIDTLNDHRDKLDAITHALLEKEILDRDELVGILGPRAGDEEKNSQAESKPAEDGQTESDDQNGASE